MIKLLEVMYVWLNIYTALDLLPSHAFFPKSRMVLDGGCPVAHDCPVPQPLGPRLSASFPFCFSLCLEGSMKVTKIAAQYLTPGCKLFSATHITWTHVKVIGQLSYYHFSQSKEVLKRSHLLAIESESQPWERSSSAESGHILGQGWGVCLCPWLGQTPSYPTPSEDLNNCDCHAFRHFLLTLGD